ncbi:hypothetical protein GCM10028804_33620 [Larkinella terrae]
MGEAPYPATETGEANAKIGALYSKILTLYAQLRHNPQFSISLLKGHVLGDKDMVWRKGDSTAVMDLAKAYLGYEEKRFRAGEIAKRTRYVRGRYIQLLEEYLTKTKQLGLEVADVRHETFDDYKFYLLTNLKYNPAYASKCLQYARQAFRWGKQNKIIAENPLSDYIIHKCESEPDTTHLEEEELSKLIQFDPYVLVDAGKISEEMARMMDEERDVLLFTCLTGMHDGDYQGKAYEILRDKTGHWIKGRRSKTKGRFEVPLDPYAMRIIRKYGGIDKLPTRSNKARNENLKLLGVLAEIPTYMTTKIGRKTFADRALNDMNMDTSDVATMLGHSDTKYLKHYAHIQNRRLIQKFVPLDTGKRDDIRRLPVDSKSEVESASESVPNQWSA